MPVVGLSRRRFQSGSPTNPAAATAMASGRAGTPSISATTPTRAYFSAADWYWNPIPTSPVLDTNSPAIVSVLAGGNHSCNIDLFAAHLIHASEVSSGTPRYSVPFRHSTGGDLEFWGPHPFGAATVPLPAGTETRIPPGDATYFDGHVSVADPTTNTVFNMWQVTSATGPPRTFGASWGGSCALNGDGRENPALGISTGSGLSRYGGPIREAEIAAGLIPHALFFSTTAATLRGSNVLGTNYVYPATNTDGSNGGGHATTIREGARVQLDPSLNLATIPGITSVELTVGKALQTYGAYCGDNGGSRMGFIFERKPGSTVYSNAGLFEYFDMTHIPWSSLRVLRQWDGS